jgi:2-polyprenyl-3-methyl-5-hydroxy-6-metoxy-1,4-benzoquinol methylase
MLKSPFSEMDDLSIISKVSSKFIIDLYKTNFQIDVSEYFKGIDELSLYKDVITDYQFFYPQIQADSLFYERLQQFDWYYMDNKWEFDEAFSQIKNKSSKVLEIGCGKGAFLKLLNKNNIENVGLELNEDSIKTLVADRINALNQTIQDFAKENVEKFDVVVSFQVLEHVFEVKSFLEAAIKTLKKGGMLILSVPNNDSFIKWAYPSALNIPPHHSGLWNLKSLKSISSIYNLTFERVYYEPLQSYHYDWYYNIFKTRMINKYGKWIKLLFIPFRNNRYRFILSKLDKKIKGHSILAIYTK